jgi:hypothetical protein
MDMKRISAVLLVAVLALGCFALDEIDQGQEVMDKHYGHARKEKEKAAAPAPAADAKEDPGVVARVRSWWEKKQAEGGGGSSSPADSGPPPHPDDVLVRCKVGGTTQFMRKFDCQLRGGKVADV